MELSVAKKLGFAAAFTLAVGSCTAWRSFEIIPPKSFGIRVTAGELQPETLNPGPVWKYPFFDDVYSFTNNTVILENLIENGNAVGSGKNTQDQNEYTAEMRIHYKIKLNAGILAFHIKEMGNESGKALVTEQENKAMNAVVGQRTTPQTIVSHADVLQAFVEQLEWRLRQNNIAVEIDTVEYLTANVGGLRLPVQLRVKPGKPVESMAGPSVPVKHLRIVAGEDMATASPTPAAQAPAATTPTLLTAPAP